MQVTGSYTNYLNISRLLSPVGVRGSGDFVMQVFASSLSNLQDKMDQQIFSKESTDALTELYHNISDLASKATPLTLTHMDSVFRDRSAVSSDINVLTATAGNAFSDDTGATEATYDISITQIAQGQENTGLQLNSADASVIGTGINTFNLTVNGQDHALSITVVDGDTNGIVLQNIEAAIDGSALGITADVITNDTDGTAHLLISADGTGLANAYSLSDVSGNAISATAADTESTVAQDAMYSVDGIDQTSGVNTVYLDDEMVVVTFGQAGDAILKIAPDESEVNNAISTFVSEINAFIDFNKSSSDYIEEDVLSTVNSFISDHRAALESLGITRGDDGKLHIDSGMLTAAVRENLSGVKDTFGGFDGVAVRTHSYASEVSTDSPLNYAKEAGSMSVAFADYIYNASVGMMKLTLTGSLVNSYA
ncbi:MAG: flagellar filament capping protein FliD [Desulfobacterales bacterium]